jgi:hypothetical protein
MLKQKRSLLWEFAACIFAVFVAFLVFPLLLRASWCEPTLKNQWGIYGNNYASQQQYASNSVPDTVVIHQQQAANQNSNSNKIYSEYLRRTGFCEDTKFTDWALVFFHGLSRHSRLVHYAKWPTRDASDGATVYFRHTKD